VSVPGTGWIEETAAGCDHSLGRSHGGTALNQRSTNAARFALKGVALAAACLWGTQAAALGLGRLAVQSALGETLKAEIDVTSMTAEEASSLKLRVAPPEAYRSAGVEYNAALATAKCRWCAVPTDARCCVSPATARCSSPLST
jgi:type IV secretory pathway TrbL component